MALLNFDPESLILRVVAGALEKYEPSDKVKELSKNIEELRQKVKAEQDKHAQSYKDFLAAEVTPLIEKFRAEADGINKATYPELDKVRAGQQESAKPAA